VAILGTAAAVQYATRIYRNNGKQHVYHNQREPDDGWTRFSGWGDYDGDESSTWRSRGTVRDGQYIIFYHNINGVLTDINAASWLSFSRLAWPTTITMATWTGGHG